MSHRLGYTWDMNSHSLVLKPDLTHLLRPLTDLPLDEFAEELVVLELYRRRQISSGKAAELLGMERASFIQYASRLGLPFFDMTQQELDAEISRLNEWMQPE